MADYLHPVRQAFERAMRRLDLYRSLALPRAERMRKYPFGTLWHFLVSRWFGALRRLGLRGPLVTARTFWGDRMRVVFPDHRAVYHYGILDGQELAVQSFLVRWLKPGDTFVDAGANTGFYTLLGSAIVGDTGSVHAFEPTPRTFGFLKENSAGKRNIHINNAALLEKPGRIEITDFGPEYGGLNSVLPLAAMPESFREGARRKHLAIRRVSAEATTLDAYAAERGIHPAVIKIDTEGSEYQAIIGARRVLAEDRPALIVEIWQDAEVKGNFARVVDFLAGLGYDAYYMDRDFQLERYEGGAVACSNIVFLPRGNDRARIFP